MALGAQCRPDGAEMCTEQFGAVDRGVVWGAWSARLRSGLIWGVEPFRFVIFSYLSPLRKRPRLILLLQLTWEGSVSPLSWPHWAALAVNWWAQVAAIV